jgi:hypothetical protein
VDDLLIDQMLAQPRFAVMALLAQPGGATCAELQAATGWQPHTVRGFLSRLGHEGNPIVRYEGHYQFERLLEEAA